MSALNPSTDSSPAPTFTSAPTTRRTIFHTKCEAARRTRISAPSSATSARSTATFVEL
jgi:hypothetical protein